MFIKTLLITICLLQAPLYASTSIRKIFKKFIETVDHPDKRICNNSNTDFIIATYQNIFEQNPTDEELTNALSLLDESNDQSNLITIKRSDLISALLAKKYDTDQLTDSILRKESHLIETLDSCQKSGFIPYLAVDQYLDNAEKQYSEETIKKYQLDYAAHTGNYNLYYGYMHAHTSYSDGEGLPEDAYTMARDQAKLDFLAVTDHDMRIAIWPWNNEWKKSKKIADKFYEPGKFVAIRGFEWSSPIFGHINVINSKRLINCITWPTVRNLYRWMGRQEKDIFARYNHPGRVKFASWGNKLEFNQFRIYPPAIKYMAGMEMFNGDSGLWKYYFNTGYNGDKNFFNTANLNGWMIGAVGGQDNHDQSWGIKNEYRVGVWALGLTRKEIINAYQERRTFATEDKNASLSFKMDGAQMGSRLHPGFKNVEIIVRDADLEIFTEINLYKNGDLLETINPTSDRVTLSLETQAGEYYHVIAKQADENYIMSSPIWIK
ncbi:MAG: hypothetical protein A2381_09130 [Bdellovibrionales bacterium RIFOXYB1_FULL_37_110]|nr:MAG: hypothetical protein A2181_05825 [Bdellovibrionales bacterium RIFOXYA1_FULL_38_20]OFZ48379.1 MAG: hypothetical protein A2417_03515 [Bdellovibrionales bacterium RIFOXYC1_FULL_37_79]OFZ61048.1 MAG: hypothetical protein A2381_09130 [Bdellovibrionales bacterium RIFOXYB1_FULL_37_110]OFZ65173.1 MAG: hypothetical protein A2577_04990 [Bdellovibrionales bacterium RIFOXYD1_FULL_36_51]